MGHRTHNAPRRGSLAYRPRMRRQRHVTRVRSWPQIDAEKPVFLGAIGFKAGSIHVITVDDRENLPNFGKPLFNQSTVIACAPFLLLGVRAYENTNYGLRVFADFSTETLPKNISKKIKFNTKSSTENIEKIKNNIDKIHSFRGIVSTLPKNVGLSQKTPLISEIGISGGTLESQFEYLSSQLGKEFTINDIFSVGSFVDTFGVTKGKGWQGPVKRFGIKKKESKSRKTVREVGTINPWKPTTVRYTVPRAGQMGFHQRLDRNKQILFVGNENNKPITPSKGFDHFGVLRGDYIIVKGSVPGPNKRPVTLRQSFRPRDLKIPKILEVSTVQGEFE